MIQHTSLLGLENCDASESESLMQKGRELVGKKLPIVSDTDGEIGANRCTIQMGEQIARWTRARELRSKDATWVLLQGLVWEDEAVYRTRRYALILHPKCWDLIENSTISPKRAHQETFFEQEGRLDQLTTRSN